MLFHPSFILSTSLLPSCEGLLYPKLDARLRSPCGAGYGAAPVMDVNPQCLRSRQTLRRLAAIRQTTLTKSVAFQLLHCLGLWSIDV